MNEIKVVELFGGIGAIRKAMINKNIKFDVIDYVEKDKNAVKSYNALYGENYKPCDIQKYNLPNHKQIDILMHGSPCQDFSISGKMEGGIKGSNTRSSLLWETVRIIKNSKKKPKIIIWENVANVLSKNFEFIFYDYIDELSKIGYESKYKILEARDFGIPQTRPRVFCISILGKNKFDFSKLKNIPMKNLNLFLEEEPSSKFIIPDTTIKRLKKCNQLRIIKYYSYTIATKPDYNYGGYIKLNDGSFRSLTTKETCRLMGFSDNDYDVLSKLHNEDENKVSTILHKQFGNSIVVDVLEAILEELIKFI